MISCYRLIDTPDRISERPPRGGLSFCAGRFVDVRLWPLADISTAAANIRFPGQSGHQHIDYLRVRLLDEP